jgi:hypothetical protein
MWQSRVPIQRRAEYERLVATIRPEVGRARADRAKSILPTPHSFSFGFPSRKSSLTTVKSARHFHFPRQSSSRRAHPALDHSTEASKREDSQAFAVMENLPDGCFVRLNASIMREGSFGDCLASFVGKFENRTTFVCSDGGRITLSDEQCEMDSLAQDMVVELVGQCLGPDSIAVRSLLCRESWHPFDWRCRRAQVNVESVP